MSSSQEVEEIKTRIGVDELLKEYLKLVPAGTGTYKAICPFHNEKTPSMMVSPQRGSWHCFGCGAGGDIFEFLMKIENLSFPEALKVLADRAGVTLTRQNPQTNDRKNRLYEVCELASRYWYKILSDSPRAQAVKEYLSRRGISEESIEKFRIGYAVDEWDNLFQFLIKRGFKAEEIFQAGLSIKKDRGSGFYDRFRHRVMFPIVDHHGRTVGFGGRALKADEPAKYINSPQTEIYNKSAILYGLYWAKEAIRKSDQCILVEGYMDVIPSHQAGVGNAISISGTALTEEQLRLIKRYTNNLALSLDMDEAGQRAALRSIELALTAEMDVKVITLPSGKDPGECATNNPEEWKRAVANAEFVMEYFFKRATAGRDLNSPEDKKKIAAFLIGKIVQIGNPVERDHWIKELATRLGVAEESVRELAKKTASQSPSKAILRPQEAATEVQVEKVINDHDLLRFRGILAMIWIFPEFLSKLAEELKPEYLDSELARSIYKNLILFYTTHNELFALGARGREETNIFPVFIKWLETQAVITGSEQFLEQSYLLAQKDFASLEAREAKNEIETLLKLLKGNYLSAMIARLNNDLRQAEKEGDKLALEKISISLSDLIRQKSEL